MLGSVCVLCVCVCVVCVCVLACVHACMLTQRPLTLNKYECKIQEKIDFDT